MYRPPGRAEQAAARSGDSTGVSTPLPPVRPLPPAEPAAPAPPPVSAQATAPVPTPASAPTEPVPASRPEPEKLPFHRYLQKAREARGMSIDDLAHQTKIRRAILEAVENDARRDLPEKVFVLGYVRSYALAVGVPVEEAARRFQAAWADDVDDAELLEAIRPRRSWAWVPLVLSSGVLVAVVWYVVNL
jgi:hypothetical protein